MEVARRAMCEGGLVQWQCCDMRARSIYEMAAYIIMLHIYNEYILVYIRCSKPPIDHGAPTHKLRDGTVMADRTTRWSLLRMQV
jgi:hypothetical protein